MTTPLVVLAVFAAGVGAVLAVPPWHLFGSFLSHAPGLVEGPEHAMNPPLMGVSGLIALAGIGLAWWMYVIQPSAAAEAARTARPAYVLSSNKFFIDELYDAFIVKPIEGFARAMRWFDQHVVDGLVDLIGQVPRYIGALFWPIQNGLVQYYALLMVLGLAVFLIALGALPSPGFAMTTLLLLLLVLPLAGAVASALLGAGRPARRALG